MTNVAVIGAQWGDEGKGKVVDWLASRAEIVVRFQGGHNAGHTLVVGDETYRLSLLPSGVVRGKLGIIGNGVVIDPEALLAEIDRVGAQGLAVTPATLRIADNAPLILPVHGALDRAREAARGDAKIGTTGRGIGPAYEDKVARRAIRVCDLAEPETLSEKLDELLRHHNTLLAGLGAETFSRDDLLGRLLALAPRILPFAEPVWERLDEARRAGTRILFEGAQAVMLDVDHGTYPFVTSSNTVAATAASGSGVGPGVVGTVLGIAKAYTTRVGSGPFPTELSDAIGRSLGERGREFGTVTGRPRRCGWFDAVMVRQAVKIGGIHGLALTKLDELLRHHNTLLAGLGAETFSRDDLLGRLLALAPRILPFAEPVWERLDEARRAGTRILFEGAQAVMLDVDHGTYPFVTSSNTVAATAASGSGVGPGVVGTVLGIAKAYTTRVGSGPFPTELSDAIGRLLGERGREFGTVTGRPRRCGWFDAVMVRQAVKIGGIHGLALTKLDVLDEVKELSICVGYRTPDGAVIRRLPAGMRAQAAVRPVYEAMPGWLCSTRGARSWADLPAQAIKYVRRIEELTEAPVTLVSTSPERDDTILVRDPFEG